MKPINALLRPLLTLTVLLSLIACAARISEGLRFHCPPLKAYTPAQQTEAHDYLVAHPDGAVSSMIVDYGQMRAECRAISKTGD